MILADAGPRVVQRIEKNVTNYVEAPDDAVNFSQVLLDLKWPLTCWHSTWTFFISSQPLFSALCKMWSSHEPMSNKPAISSSSVSHLFTIVLTVLWRWVHRSQAGQASLLKGCSQRLRLLSHLPQALLFHSIRMRFVGEWSWDVLIFATSTWELTEVLSCVASLKCRRTSV